MRRSLVRKIVLMIGILACFVATWPARLAIEYMRSEEYQKEHPEVHLSQATLGNVDPTNAAILLILGGLRGVAANYLWVRAEDLQKNHRWSELALEVDRIIKLQPHFVSVWRFQSWNLAYNVSAEWDQVNDKYYWIREGIRFAQRGTEVNQHEETLSWWTGWCYFHKIGKADEARLLRELFRDDTEPEIDARGVQQPPFNPKQLDNYEAAEVWFVRAEQKLDELNRPPRQMAEVAFRSYPGHARIQLAIALEAEGQFGDEAARRWSSALERWLQFGARQYYVRHVKRYVRLDYCPEVFAAFNRARIGQTYAFAVLKSIEQNGIPQSAEDRRALAESFKLAIRNMEDALGLVTRAVLRELPEEAAPAYEAAKSKISILAQLDPEELASPEGEDARRQFKEFHTLYYEFYKYIDEELFWNDKYGGLVNYRYWRNRCIVEMEPDTLQAREYFYRAQRAFEQGDLVAAKEYFEQGLQLWAEVLGRNRWLAIDDQTAEETHELIMGPLGYHRLLRQLDEPADPARHPYIAPFYYLIDKFVPPEQYEQAMKLGARLQNRRLSDEQKRQIQQEMYRLVKEGERVKEIRKQRSLRMLERAADGVSLAEIAKEFELDKSPDEQKDQPAPRGQTGERSPDASAQKVE